MPEQHLIFDKDGIAVLNLGTSFMLNTGIFYNPNQYTVTAHFESLQDNGIRVPPGCVLEIKKEDTEGPTPGPFISTNNVYFDGGIAGDFVETLYTTKWWGAGTGSAYQPSPGGAPAGPSGPTGTGQPGGAGGGYGGGGGGGIKRV